MVGNISPNKNAQVVVDALTALAARGITVPMLHIGRDEGRHLARALHAAAIDIPIISRSGVSDDALRAAYKHAVFFLNTSLHEGFCLPVVEAQAMGTPVIASNCSAPFSLTHAQRPTSQPLLNACGRMLTLHAI
jgi:glycosyltransferase involved in cell wall biosynthesis